MSETLYKKKNGEFVPVLEHLKYEALAQGAYLLIVTPGSRTTVPLKLHPRHAQLAAAMYHLKEDLVRGLSKAATAQPTRELSPEVQKIWAEFEERLGDFKMMLQWPSYYDIVDVAIKNLEVRIIEQCTTSSSTTSDTLTK